MAHRPKQHCHVELPDLTPDRIEGLWVALVLGLTERGLVSNGLFDVPTARSDERVSVWAGDFQVLCSDCSPGSISHSLLKRPVLPPAISLAIGGPTGSGKTTLIRRLLSSPLGDRMMRYIAYTTRQPRSGETDGVDYHFVDPCEITVYQNNPRFAEYVEARGNWYWVDLGSIFRSRWSKVRAIHVFSITQVHEFLSRRAIIPDLQWIWLDTSYDEVSRRLQNRGDDNRTQSLAHCERLAAQDRTGLVSLNLDTEILTVEESLAALTDFIRAKEEKILWT